ncbi:hypothetical protein FRC02_010141 [Tulasnella sp. 418]|nr:hypothetical protein FRC02_010141 [Tulasnella sp. 418]
MIYLGGNPNATNPTFENAKVLRALSDGLKTLDDYYSKLQLTSGPAYSRFFPYLQAFPADSCGKEYIQFEYLKKLTQCNLQGKNSRYRRTGCSQVRQTIHFLRASSSCFSWTCTKAILSFKGWPTASIRPFPDDLAKLPDGFQEEVERAVKILHDNNWVFGDLRTPNIMVHNKHPLFVDFDWCTEDEVGTSPDDLNEVDGIGWHPEVKQVGIMRKKHDLFMLKKLWQ